MATFTAQQVTDIAEVLCSNSLLVAERLTYIKDQITDTDKTKALALITEWQTASTDYTRVHPKEKNFGAEINPNDKKSSLVQRIANLLYCTDLLNASGTGQGKLIRA